jgi:hypothetical protein
MPDFLDHRSIELCLATKADRLAAALKSYVFLNSGHSHGACSITCCDGLFSRGWRINPSGLICGIAIWLLTYFFQFGFRRDRARNGVPHVLIPTANRSIGGELGQAGIQQYF